MKCSVCLIAAAVLALTHPVGAFGLTYGVTGGGYTNGGGQLVCDGNYASTGIYGTYLGWFHVYQEKVNSIYAYNIYNDIVEVGVDWTGLLPNSPMTFTVNYSPSTGYRERWLDYYPSPGTSMPTQLKRYTDLNPDSFDWSYYVNNTRKGTWYDIGMRSAYIYNGSERQSGLDNGNASWTYVKYLPHRGSTWYYWPHAVAGSDNDPGYWFNAADVDDSNHWLHVDAQ